MTVDVNLSLSYYVNPKVYPCHDLDKRKLIFFLVSRSEAGVTG